MSRWIAEIESVVRRVARGSAFADVADPGGLARAISAAFIGLELYEGIDRAGALAALDVLEQLGSLVAMVDDLGPVETRVLRGRVRRTRRSGR